MNTYGKDYQKLYKLQDKFLHWWAGLGLPFYLTGETALGRFYLNHRFSEDLDFFTNADENYHKHITVLYNEIKKQFRVDSEKSLFGGDFTRIFITDSDTILKIELVNDVSAYIGMPAQSYFGIMDTPLNILTNTLTAIVSRDEPKDFFDIMHLALNYSFSWLDIFNFAKNKAVINEIDIEMRLNSFPVSLLGDVDWHIEIPDMETVKKNLRKISSDFILGKRNTLGINKIPIGEAKPIIQEL